MSVVSVHASVGTGAPSSPIAEGTPAAGTGGVPGSHVVVKPSGGDVYFGGSDVSSSNGFLVADGGSLAVDLETGEGLYARSASGTVTVHVLKSGV